MEKLAICARPVCLIEAYTFRCLELIFRSYSTFNRDIQKNNYPIPLIETVLIIETQEYSNREYADEKTTIL